MISVLEASKLSYHVYYAVTHAAAEQHKIDNVISTLKKGKYSQLAHGVF